LRDQLSAVAEARAAVQAQINAAQALPAAHLQAVFRGSALIKWPTKPLIEVAEISGGVTLGRDLRGRPARQVPYLRVANVKDGWLDLSHVKEVEATEAEIGDCRLRFGDLLLTEGGDPDKLGRGTYWQEQLPECIHQNHIFRVRFDLSASDPAFAAAQFGSPYGKAYFLAHAKQTTGIATINRTVLSKFPFLTPPFAEQRAIAARLEADQTEAASLTSALAEKLTALDHLPAALLREAFAGRL
jgi:type I restriction enzyme S subunit